MIGYTANGVIRSGASWFEPQCTSSYIKIVKSKIVDFLSYGGVAQPRAPIARFGKVRFLYKGNFHIKLTFNYILT